MDLGLIFFYLRLDFLKLCLFRVKEKTSFFTKLDPLLYLQKQELNFLAASVKRKLAVFLHFCDYMCKFVTIEEEEEEITSFQPHRAD